MAGEFRRDSALNPLGEPQPNFGGNQSRVEILGKGLPREDSELSRETRRADPADGNKKPGLFGLGSKEEEALKAAGEMVSINSSFYRPLENLKWADYSTLEARERLQINETLRSSLVDGHITFEKRLSGAIETFDYKTQFYPLQGERERLTQQVVLYEGLLYSAKEGANERLLGLEISDLHRQESGIKIAEWALPYKVRYYSGMESLGVLPERGGQLYLGDVDKLMNGVDAAWLEGQPEALNPEQFPESEVEKRAKEIQEWNDIKDQLPLVENGETVADRYARYVADTDFFTRIVGEMNTYNPTVPGEALNVSETMQQFLGDLLQRKPRTYEDGSLENIELPSRKIEVYLDAKGEQIPFKLDQQGRQIRPANVKDEDVKSAFVETVDYYNKTRSEHESRLFICTVSALAIHNAKHVLENLPADIASAKKAQGNDQDGSKYNQLFAAVQKTVQDMLANYDIPPKKQFNYKLARSAFYLADSIAFGSFDIAERGWNYTWTQEEVKNKDGSIAGYRWKTEPSQGDPTASGDAFSAARPYFHEVVYQAIKSRVSSFGQGINLPIDPAEGEKMAQIYVSEAAEINDRQKTIEMIKSGKHQYLATYFGILGAFKDELGHLPVWKDGEAKRQKFGKQVNPNLSKAVEKYVIFAPTPFNFKTVDLSNTNPNNKALIDYVKSTGLTNGENVIFPIIAPQQKIGLFDMLSAGREYTVGDLLRKTWKRDNNGILHESTLKDGGKRLTLQDINWQEYARYADDGRAVNNNFMLQLFAPIYGPLNSKQVEVVAQNPMVSITSGIKAADIGMRAVLKKLDNPTQESGTMVKRPSLEILHAASITFQQLALGVHGLVGRGKVVAFKDFIEEITPGEIKKQSNNIYTVLRAAEDLLPEKQKYKHYSDSWCTAFLAMMYALEPVTIASNEMAAATTKRFYSSDPTGAVQWNKLAKSEETKNIPLKRSQ